MRWYVEVSPLRPSLVPGAQSAPEVESYVVEAKAWQAALQAAREFKGTAGPISQFSIELLPDGYRAVDPVGRLRYLIKRAPDDAVATIHSPPSSKAVVAAARAVEDRPTTPAPDPKPAVKSVGVSPPAAVPPPPRVPAPSAGTSPGAYSVAEPALRPTEPGSAPPAPAAPAAVSAAKPSVATSEGPATSAASSLKQTQKSPELDPLPMYERMTAREENPSATSPMTYREYVYVVPHGTPENQVERLVRSCFFDVLGDLATVSSGKFVNLAVFDVVFTGKPPRPPLATLMWKDWRGPEPEIRFPARERAAAMAAKVAQAPLPPPPEPPRVAEPPAPDPTESIDVMLDEGPATSAMSTAAPPTVVEPPRAPPGPPPPPVATRPAVQEVVKSITESVRIAVAKRKSEPPPPMRVVGKRLSGDDLLGDLFESMHDLHFATTVLDGARFVLTLASTKLPSKVAICHFFDINKREYVVVDVLGADRDKLVLTRIPERDELANATVRRRRAVVIADGSTDPRVKGGRWDVLGAPISSLVTAPVALGGRYLGMLELANPIDGVPYTESDGYALSYMGEQLAEFLGQRGVLIEPEVVRAFKPKG